LEGISDGRLEGVDGSGGGFAQAGFEFGVSILDRVEIGRIGWQQQKVGAAGLDQDSNGGAFMCRQIVHHGVRDIAGTDITFAFRDKLLAQAAADALTAIRADGTYDRLFDKFGMTKLKNTTSAIRGDGPTN
jgi:hypothetical protein